MTVTLYAQIAQCNKTMFSLIFLYLLEWIVFLEKTDKFDPFQLFKYDFFVIRSWKWVDGLSIVIACMKLLLKE